MIATPRTIHAEVKNARLSGVGVGATLCANVTESASVPAARVLDGEPLQVLDPQDVASDRAPSSKGDFPRKAGLLGYDLRDTGMLP